MEDQEEILDLVNEEDSVIGTIKRSESHKLAGGNLGYIRATDMFIKNSKGQLWIPKRTATKTIAPNGLDYSCGGHVSSGDGYDETMIREIEEELNFKPDKDKLHFIVKMPPDTTPYYRAVYIYESDIEPEYNRDDFVSAEWLTPEELLAKLDSGIPAKSSIKETILKLKQLNAI
jgi:isopentenyldiphosphate isomerase